MSVGVVRNDGADFMPFFARAKTAAEIQQASGGAEDMLDLLHVVVGGSVAELLEVAAGPSGAIRARILPLVRDAVFNPTHARIRRVRETATPEKGR